MKRIVLLGPPASGKGTQGIRLADALGVDHVSTGHLLRRSMDRGDPFKIRPLVLSGGLVPDEVVEKLLWPLLDEGFILDGYPRTAEQAERLDGALTARDLDLDHILEIRVAEETLAARMMLRASSEKRSDDTPEVFMRRLEEYRKDIEPIRAYYADRLTPVDGSGDQDEVFARMLEAAGA